MIYRRKTQDKPRLGKACSEFVLLVAVVLASLEHFGFSCTKQRVAAVPTDSFVVAEMVVLVV